MSEIPSKEVCPFLLPVQKTTIAQYREVPSTRDVVRGEEVNSQLREK